jgi:hypothetical protein
LLANIRRMATLLLDDDASREYAFGPALGLRHLSPKPV